MEKPPFKDIYIHGLVRDEKGNKMSKSKGNVIDPLVLCDKYGADAVRYTLASLASPGRDLKMSDQLVETGRNFLTKLWNVVRFAQMNGCTYNQSFNPDETTYPLNRWIIQKVKEMVQSVDDALNNYRFDDASKIIYQCVWNEFCDWYMEFVKPILQQTSWSDSRPEGYVLEQTLLKKDVRDTIAWVVIQFTRVLYPIAPFIAKKLSGELGVTDIQWPTFEYVKDQFSEDVKKAELLKESVSAIRSIRQCLHIPSSEKLSVKLESVQPQDKEFLETNSNIVSKMSGVSFSDDIKKSIPLVLNGLILHISVGESVDIHKEIGRLTKENIEFIKMRDAAMFRLNNQDFMSKASPDVVEEHKKRVHTLSDKISKTEYVISKLEKLI